MIAGKRAFPGKIKIIVYLLMINQHLAEILRHPTYGL
jgi:hypothetical protein